MSKNSLNPTHITEVLGVQLIKGIAVLALITLPIVSNAQSLQNSAQQNLLAVAASDTKSIKEETSESNFTTAITVVPTWAQNTGEDLQGYLVRTLKYPATASLNNISGEVKVKFTVNIDGSISNVGIVKGLNPEIENKVLEVVKSMPSWQPGLFNGKPVAMNYILPINFQLKHETVIPN